MPDYPPCSDCSFGIPPSANRCPHCGRPGLFPNVRAAQTPAEQVALQARYEAALTEAETRGAAAKLHDFEAALANSKAVICRSLHETLRMAGSEYELYSTYYKLADADVRMPSGEKWDALRTAADAALFTNYHDELRFAALTLDEQGLSNYGACSWLLRTEMIAHRTSVMDENSTMFVKYHDLKIGDADQVPPGYRAVWDERGKLAVAKLGDRIDATTTAAEYSVTLLRQGSGSADDEFIEAQIYGPLTIRTIEHLTINPRASKAERAVAKALKEKLKGFGVTIK